MPCYFVCPGAISLQFVGTAEILIVQSTFKVRVFFFFNVGLWFVLGGWFLSNDAIKHENKSGFFFFCI